MRLLLSANTPILSSIVANGTVLVPQQSPSASANARAQGVPKGPQVKIPRIPLATFMKVGIWVLVVVLGLVTVGLLLQRFNLLRFIQPTPQQVRVTNISSNSFVVSWTTTQKTRGRVLYTTDSAFGKDVLTAYDAKDRQVAQQKSYNNFVESTGSGTVQINQGAFAATNITIQQAGNYYTHYVLVENTKPSTTYYFKLDNYLGSWDQQSVTKITNKGSELLPVADTFVVTTKEVESSLAVPNPSYGTVVAKDGKPIQDALVYAVIELPQVEDSIPALRSEGVVSLVNNEGGYYFDFARMQARNGEPLEINDDAGTKQYVLVETNKDPSITETTLDKNAPLPEIKLTSTRGFSTFSLKQAVLSARAQSDSSGSGTPQDTSSGQASAYTSLWNVQTVLHMGCVGGSNKLLGPQGCGALSNSTYDVYVCQCGAFATDDQYQASAYKANEGRVKALLESSNEPISDSALTERPCEPSSPIVLKDLELNKQVARIDLSAGDFGIGLVTPTTTFEKDCKDGSGKKKFKADASAVVQIVGTLFNPKTYKGLCLWKPMNFASTADSPGLDQCKDESGKTLYPIPTTAAGQKVPPYDYAKKVCNGTDGGETAAQNCGFGSIVDDGGVDGGSGTPTPTGTTKVCGDIDTNECKVDNGGRSLRQCQASGVLKTIGADIRQYSCINGTFSWNGEQWVSGSITPTPTPQSCTIDGVQVASNTCKATGGNLALCNNGNAVKVAECRSIGQKQTCVAQEFTCSSSLTWTQTGGGTIDPNTACKIDGATVASNTCHVSGPQLTACVDKKVYSLGSCSTEGQTVQCLSSNYTCKGRTWVQTTGTTTVPSPIVTPYTPPANECALGEYTRGTLIWKSLYGCVGEINPVTNTMWYHYSSAPTAICMIGGSWTGKYYPGTDWYCGTALFNYWYKKSSSSPSPATLPETPPAVAVPTPIIVYPSTTPSATPSAAPSTDWSASESFTQLVKQYCTAAGGRFTMPDGSQCECPTDLVSGIVCSHPVEIRPISSQKRSALLPAVQAQDSMDLIVSDKGYYIVPKTTGTYEITVPGKGKITALLRSGSYNTLYVDKNNNKRYDVETDELISINIKEVSVKQITSTQSVILSPGFNFVSFPYLFKDGLNSDKSSSYFYGRSTFLQSLNKSMPAGVEVTLLSRFANGSFDDTTVYRKDTQQTYNKDNGLIPGQGYVVKVLGSSKVFSEYDVYRTLGSLPLDLGSGWNLVGVYSPNQPYTASSFVQKARQQSDTFRGVINNVTRWENGRYDGIVFDGEKEFGFDFPIDPFRSYFVRVQGECDFNNCGSIKP